MSDTNCPLCRKDRPARTFKTLYGSSVCSKCYYGFGNRRQLAFVLDWFLWYFVSYALGVTGTVMLLVIHAPDAAVTAFLVVGAYVAAPLAFFCKDGFGGHSPGRAICGVQVIDRDTHAPIGFRTSFKRNLIIYVPLMPILIALMLFKGHRVGDGWANTKVVWKKHAEHPVFTGRWACVSCQYDLRGNTTGVCPECGTPTAPAHRVAA